MAENLSLILAEKSSLVSSFVFKGWNDFKAFVVSKKIKLPLYYVAEQDRYFVIRASQRYGQVPSELEGIYVSRAVAEKALLQYYARRPEILGKYSVFWDEEVYLTAVSNSKAIADSLKASRDKIAIDDWLKSEWNKALLRVEVGGVPSDKTVVAEKKPNGVGEKKNSSSVQDGASDNRLLLARYKSQINSLKLKVAALAEKEGEDKLAKEKHALDAAKITLQEQEKKEALIFKLRERALERARSRIFSKRGKLREKRRSAGVKPRPTLSTKAQLKYARKVLRESGEFAEDKNSFLEAKRAVSVESALGRLHVIYVHTLEDLVCKYKAKLAEMAAEPLREKAKAFLEYDSLLKASCIFNRSSRAVKDKGILYYEVVRETKLEKMAKRKAQAQALLVKQGKLKG